MENNQAVIGLVIAVAAFPGFPLLFAKRFGQAAFFAITGVLLAVYYAATKDQAAGYGWFLVAFTGWIAAIVADKNDDREDREKLRHYELLTELRHVANRVDAAASQADAPK